MAAVVTEVRNATFMRFFMRKKNNVKSKEIPV